MTERTYLIVGNGMAGISAAQEIRRLDEEGRIVLVGDEDESYYYRASLSEWISGQNTADMLPGRMDAFYEWMGFEQVDGYVVEVDPGRKLAYLAGGQALAYDRLLIATGARPNTFPIEGLKDIVVFRRLADAQEIKRRAGTEGRVLILGGGILGLELAGALHEMGTAHIAVVQRSEFVGRPLLDAPSAEWLQARMRADGVTLFVRDTVVRVEGQTAVLYCDREWASDLFVQAIGITPCFPRVPDLVGGKGI